jgi:hypothetical protein
MAQDFGPEIHASMAKPNPRLGAGLGKPRPVTMGAAPPQLPMPGGAGQPGPSQAGVQPPGGNLGQPHPMPGVQNATLPHQGGPPPPDMHNVAAATSIAHAILNGRNTGKLPTGPKKGIM